MRLVKTILVPLALAALLALALAHGPVSTASPTTPPSPGAHRLARGDLAEAVFSMVLQNAKTAGLAQPLTLCQACVAAHLGLPTDAVRERCQRACGLP